MPINTHFDLLASLYDRAARPPQDPAWLAGLLKLPVDGRLLDAGGGTGRIAQALAGQTQGWVICDLSLPMLRRAQHKGPQNVALAGGRAQALPFRDGAFARCLVVDALHHFGEQQAALHELARVLQPGGRLVIEEPDIRAPGVKLIALVEKLALMGSHFYQAEEIRAMLQSAGLVAQVESDGQGTVWVLGEKRVQ